MNQSTTEVSTKSIEEHLSEIEDEEDSSDSDKGRAMFSMALSVIITSISLQMVTVLNGVLVGVALWFIVAMIISNVFKIAGWRADEQSELSDIELLKLAYKRDLISDEQFKKSLDDNLD